MDLEFLRTLDPGTVLAVCGGLCLLCLVGNVLLFGLQILGLLFELVGNLFEVLFGFLNAGPVAWCGCIVLIGLLIGCGVLFSLVSTALSACGTPDATNICTLFGR